MQKWCVQLTHHFCTVHCPNHPKSLPNVNILLPGLQRLQRGKNNCRNTLPGGLKGGTRWIQVAFPKRRQHSFAIYVLGRSLSSAALDHCAVDLWLEQGAFSPFSFKINIPVAFCEVLMGSDISLPWVHLALTLPRMQLGRTSMIEQINSPKLHCVRKTKQVCFALQTQCVVHEACPISSALTTRQWPSCKTFLFNIQTG